ncbi:hypothetical protein AGMMS50225_28540 [Betaproteobacteria bacterium]|nr:hypothetical protein AGMMS50225_28540 [Betaproteobacteria bacterium]
MKNPAKQTLALLAVLAFSVVWAETPPEETLPERDLYTSKSSGLVVLLPPPPPPNDENEMPAGTLHFPGREYRSGDGWWMLACNDRECGLHPARLDVSAHPHPQYDQGDCT